MSLSMRLSISPDPEPDGGEIVMETDTDIQMNNGDDSATRTSSRHASQHSIVSHSSNSSTSDLDMVPEFDNKRAKIDYFSKDVTAITEYLYVGGKKVASSEEKLKEKGITHIINCCGDVCENYFPNEFHYLKLHLLDSAEEDIMCVLYKVIDFIDAVRKGKKKVLVHCQQGVSRSTVLVIAYLMYHENSDYDTIYEYVRARRGICRPNVGFMCQLLAWRKRVTKGSSRPYCLYRIGPHNARDRSLVTKWVDRVEAASLDSRTLFMLQVNAQENNSTASSHPSTPANSMTIPASASNLVSPNAAAASSSLSPSPSSSSPSSILFIWVGSLCPKSHEKQYLPYLAHLIAKLQMYEHAGSHVVVIRQKGREKIERAEAARFGASPKRAHQHAQDHAHAHPSAPNVTADSQPSFSSDQISAAFHTLEAAPAILAATSLSSLYPLASAKETSAFYRILGLDESEDYSRVGMDQSHAISGAILINEELNDDYSDVNIPDVVTLNESAIRASATSPISSSSGGGAGGGKYWLVPPVVRVRKDGGEANGNGTSTTGGAAADDDAIMVDGDTDQDIAARFNRTPRTSVSKGEGGMTLKLPGARFGGGASSGASSDGEDGPSISLPKKLFLASSSHSPEKLTPRSTNDSPSGFITTTAVTKPRLSLGLSGLRNGGGGGDSDRGGGGDGMEDIGMEISTIPIMPSSFSPSSSTPQYLSTGTPLTLDDCTPRASPMTTPATPSHGVLLSPSSLRSPMSHQALNAPYALFEFPRFDSGPLIAYTRSSLTPGNVYLLHHAPAGRLFVWMGPPGSLFIPSKYEGDREAFAGDIARIFQLATAAVVNSINIENSGKESEEFWLGFSR